MIATNNTFGALRWGVLLRKEIDHVNMLYDPLWAAFPRNAMGGILRITTRTSEQTEVTLKQIGLLQSCDLSGMRAN